MLFTGLPIRAVSTNFVRLTAAPACVKLAGCTGEPRAGCRPSRLISAAATVSLPRQQSLGQPGAGDGRVTELPVPSPGGLIRGYKATPTQQERRADPPASIEGPLRDILTHILDTASNFVSVNDREVELPLLRGKSDETNLFFFREQHAHAYRFDIAATRLSADVYTLDIAQLHGQGRIAARHHRQPVGHGCRSGVVRHSESGAPYLISPARRPMYVVINR